MTQKHFTKGMTSNCLKGSHFVLGSACFYQSVQHEAAACKTCPLQCLAFELWLFGKHAAKYQWSSEEYCGKWMQYEVGNHKCVIFIMYLYVPLYIMQCTYSFSHLFATSAVLQHWLLPSLLWPLHLADWNWKPETVMPSEVPNKRNIGISYHLTVPQKLPNVQEISFSTNLIIFKFKL